MLIKNSLSVLFGLIIISMFLSPATVKAIEPLSSEELTELCKDYPKLPDSHTSLQCIRYIKGFIDGAIATDAGVAKNANDESEESSSFTERAINTRIGHRIKRYNISVNSDFCLGEPLLLGEIVGKVTEELTRIPQTEKLALTIVYRVLRQNYPCEKS